MVKSILSYQQPCQSLEPLSEVRDIVPIARGKGAVRATAVGRDAEQNAVLAGDPKGIRLLCNTTLITDIPRLLKQPLSLRS